MFHDPGLYHAAQLLEQYHTQILAEFTALHQREFVPWPERYLYGEGWTIFGLYNEGKAIDYTCQMCPETAQLLASIDGVSHAGFSRLAPRTHIKPHKGRPKSELRFHLGVIIPEGDAALRVDTQTRKWVEGECLVFDDTLEHEAWNYTAEDRIVLLVDIPG